jgi:tetratricopeptide (TPR) repeat protein
VLGVDIAEAAAKFKAEYVMTGEVRQESGHWIVSADLERAADLTSLWGETFDVSRDKVTGAAEVIAGSLTSALKRRFPNAIGVSPALGAAQRTSNSEAYGLYLRGQEKLNRRGKSVKESVELFRNAIHADTLFAKAYAGLSMALSLFPYFQSVPPKEIHDDVVRAAGRALELDPTLAVPHVALGLVAQYEFKWDDAATEFQTAIRLDGHDVEARVQYSRHLMFRGRLEEAMRQLGLARTEDPASAVVLSHTSYYYYLNHQMDSALADSRWALENDSTNVTSLGLGSLVQLGNNNFKEARRLADRAPPSFLANDYVLAKSGDPDAARQHLQTQEAQVPRPWMAETRRGMTFIALGDTASALSAMERATDSAEIWPLVLGTKSPVYDPIRRSPRFQALLRRVGLAP